MSNVEMTSRERVLTTAHQARSGRLFWSNINVGIYELPPEQIRQVVLQRVSEAAPDGRLLAFQVSEQYPDNWQQSMPVVLQVLHETHR